VKGSSGTKRGFRPTLFISIPESPFIAGQNRNANYRHLLLSLFGLPQKFSQVEFDIVPTAAAASLLNGHFCDLLPLQFTFWTLFCFLCLFNCNYIAISIQGGFCVQAGFFLERELD
jgi:hypothetical protein